MGCLAGIVEVIGGIFVLIFNLFKSLNNWLKEKPKWVSFIVGLVIAALLIALLAWIIKGCTAMNTDSNNDNWTICYKCYGQGTIVQNGNRIKCPRCRGVGYVPG